MFVRTHKEESKHFTLGGMPVTGWLRGTVKAVPSGDTVLIVANAGPTVRASCIYIYVFGGVCILLLLLLSRWCFFSLSRCVFSFVLGPEIITGVSLVSESSSSFESSSFPDDDVFFLSLTTLLHTPGSFLSSFSSERGSAAGEDRHARGHHRPQNGTGEDF